MLTSSCDHIIFLPLVLLLALLSAMAPVLLAAKPLIAQTAPPHSDPDRKAGAQHHWQASYWNSMDLKGTPALQRSEPSLSHDWGWGSPDSRVNADRFSARWTRYIETTPGHYRFFATSDDGIRVFVDGDRIINSWYDRGVRTDTADVTLSFGHHLIEVEFYERTGIAVTKVWWTALNHDGSGDWRGEYYNNRHLAGSPALVRNDRRIDFDWRDGSPAPGTIRVDDFSVRWTRTTYFDEGRYQFRTETDDGVRLFIDNRLIIDEWYNMSRDNFSYSLHLDQGRHTIRMEYFEDYGDAYAGLRWDGKDEEEEKWHVGNIITCAPPQPGQNTWIKIYRLDPGGEWLDMAPHGIGPICASGHLKIDGIPVDVTHYGEQGQPCRVELWIDGHIARSVGNTQAGEAVFRVRPDADNFTPWQCAPL